VRVVLDSNILISAFIVPGGKAEQAFTLAVRRRYRALTSIPILTETGGKLRQKFDLDDRTIAGVLRTVARAAEIVRPSSRLSVVRGPPDNRILECAVDGRADAIVTGDRGLLELKEFRGVALLRLVDLLRTFPVEDR